MLKLEKITKTYNVADQEVHALRGVDMEFRNSEFVSILGPSGCGKTTLLNIVGGLDRYTSGDLIINGKSTKDFKNKDWDNYRNHKVGFVFQSYNLIPHQTVLENVELALTLSGVSKKERQQRAIDVLKRVGLGDKIKNKPNQLSGGQMQRVAIARALVNDPEIILADEPTGALDSTTSVQIMELLKEISKDRLIIMVTHNPELAEKYSTRIIRLFDGNVEGDTMPLTDKERKEEQKKEEKEKQKQEKLLQDKKYKPKKTKMSYFTALALSFKNLLTKKGRTVLIAFAGSIGIIGIALILAISSGFSAYITKTQEDTLSNYPITIYQQQTDAFSMMMSLFKPKSTGGNDGDAIYGSDTMSGIFEEASNQLANTNDLESFSKYLEENKDKIKDYVSDIKYTYGLDYYVTTPNGVAVEPESTALYDMILTYACVYLESEFAVDFVNNGDHTFTLSETDKTTDVGRAFLNNYLPAENRVEFAENKTTTVTEVQFVSIIKKAMGIDLSTYSKMNFGLFNEMIDNSKLLMSQYELLGTKSTWANDSNEVMLVLGKDSELDDYVLYTLGLISEQEMKSHMQSLFTETKNQIKINFDDVVGKEYKILLESDYWYEDGGAWVCIKNEKGEITDVDKYNQILADSTKGKTVKIAGVVRLKEDSQAGQLSDGIAFLKDLTEELITYHNNSAVVKSEQAGTPSEVSRVPVSISFYASSFEAKDVIEDFIATYNKTVEEDKQIDYTDYVGLIMSSVSTIINAITYILVAFVGVSLVVSSIMIGVITYISVIERTKEIGVLRSVGASKKDVKRVFTAESFIIGLASGVFGIFISLVLTIPINLILNFYTGLGAIATLPVGGSLILVLISVVLTLIAGLIPARSAAKKDPVIALREN